MALFISDRFPLTKDGKNYGEDAIVLPKAEYEALTASQIAALKQERIDNWVTTINTPPKPIDPQEQLANIDKDLASLDEQKAQLLSVKADLQKEK